MDQLLTLRGQRLEGRDRGDQLLTSVAAAGGSEQGWISTLPSVGSGWRVGTGVDQLLTLSGQLLLLMA